MVEAGEGSIFPQSGSAIDWLLRVESFGDRESREEIERKARDCEKRFPFQSDDARMLISRLIKANPRFWADPVPIGDGLYFIDDLPESAFQNELREKYCGEGNEEQGKLFAEVFAVVRAFLNPKLRVND